MTKLAPVCVLSFRPPQARVAFLLPPGRGEERASRKGSAPTLTQSATLRKTSNPTMQWREAAARVRQIPPRASGEGISRVQNARNSSASQPAQPLGEAGSCQDSRLRKFQSPSKESRIAREPRSGASPRQIPEKVVARQLPRPSPRFPLSRSSRRLPGEMVLQSEGSPRIPPAPP